MFHPLHERVTVSASKNLIIRNEESGKILQLLYETGRHTAYYSAGFHILGNYSTTKPEGYGILFHPDFIHGTSLGKDIKRYSFFGLSRQTGKTASEYIHGKVVDKAKEKLLSTQMTMTEIAYELGFQYPQHLSRMFKKEVGCTPNEYRMQRL